MKLLFSYCRSDNISIVEMYEPEDDYMEEGDESEEISNEIWQEACWTVISAYFEEKGEFLCCIFFTNN